MAAEEATAAVAATARAASAWLLAAPSMERAQESALEPTLLDLAAEEATLVREEAQQAVRPMEDEPCRKSWRMEMPQ
jgi:hypothetical protein